MRKTLHVAWREFASTVFTKGFIIGVLMTPLMILIVIGAMALLQNQPGPRVTGRIAVIDRSAGGVVAERIEHRFSEAGLREEAAEAGERFKDVTEEATLGLGMDEKEIAAARDAGAAAAGRLPAESIRIAVEALPPDADPEAVKADLAQADIRGTKDIQDAASGPRLALAVIPEGALALGKDGRYPGYDLFTANRLDFEIQDTIEDRIAEAVIDARIATDPRVAESGIAARDLRALLKRPRATAKTVTAEGERASLGAAAFLVPMAFMILLMISVLTSGQMLLTTTVEEKSSRVMEVLLSAVSPMQLMVGKILGQMGVGLLLLIVYAGLGIGALLAFTMGHLLDPMSVVYLIIFFMIAYFLIAAMMAAIGSAVSEMREAQNMMTPVILIIMIPWLAWMPIQRAPNSTLATVLSFIPGMNPFVMVIRLAGSEPIPAWQIPVSIAVGIASVIVAAWAAAKIFRIGVLMYGKPPNFATMIKWMRMA